MKPKAWNWRLWSGFAISLLAVFSYVPLFEITRAAIWISVLLCVVAVALIVAGLRRYYSAPESYRGKVAGPVLATLTVLMIAGFGFMSYMMKQAYSVAHNAPQVGAKAPEFALTDVKDSRITLPQLLSAPVPGASGNARAPRGVLIVFYRGYW